MAFSFKTIIGFRIVFDLVENMDPHSLNAHRDPFFLGNYESAARNTLRSLVKKGYLTEDMRRVPFVYSLEQHFPE